MPLIYSISGLRATVEDSLTEEIIRKYVQGFCDIIGDGPIVCGSDGRPSGKWIADSVLEAALSAGRDFIYAGVVPTPTVQVLVEETKAAGGIIITASHNPREWNGLKFLNADGIFLDSESISSLQIAANKNYEFQGMQRGTSKKVDNAVDIHIEKLLNIGLAKNTDILDKIRNRSLKVVVDAVNSSGSFAVPRLLELLGCEVVRLYCDGKGVFPHTPEPLPANLSDLATSVKLNGAEIGIAVDPDADRLVLIDETGRAIGEENTVVLAAMSAFSFYDHFSENFAKSAVVNYSTTMAVDDIAMKYGAQVFRSPVGEINVVKKMIRENSVIGGEGSGGVILPECHYGRDSLAGILMVLALMAETGKSLGGLAAELPRYEMIKFKTRFVGNIDDIIGKVAKKYSEYEIASEDGIKVVFPGKWFHLRSSNTEPIIRIIAEAADKADAMELIEEVNHLINK